MTLYEDVKKRLLSVGAELLHLNTSFRAPPSIQRFVNGAFAPAIAADAEASGYLPLERSRPEVTGRPTIVALPVPRPYGDFGRVTDWSINESLPGAVGAFVDWLINESGWLVEEERRAVLIRPRHIAILFRRFRASAPTSRGPVRDIGGTAIPHVLIGGVRSMIAKRSSLPAQRHHGDRMAR